MSTNSESDSKTTAPTPSTERTDTPIQEIDTTRMPQRLWKVLAIVFAVLVVLGAGVVVWNTYFFATVSTSATSFSKATTTKWTPISLVPKGLSIYELRNGKVYCTASSNTVLLPKADPATFKVFGAVAKDSTHLLNTYTKDFAHVYANCNVLSQADLETFSVIETTKGKYTYYSKDRNHVYFNTGIATASVPGADPATFATISNRFGSATSYAKDKNHVYYGNAYYTAIVRDAAPATFVVINDSLDNATSYVKDKNHVWRRRSATDIVIVPDINPSTFTIVSDFFGDPTPYAKDKNHVYYRGAVLQGSDLSTFTLISNSSGDYTHYAKDKNHVYYSNYGSVTTVPGAVPANFTVPQPPK